MRVYQPLIYKIATQDWEFEQIHRLNYRTFVEEIPQHHHNASGRLVDKFHDQNTYIVCLHGEQLIGMVALRAERPFSLDQKVADLDSHLPDGRKLCEVRLLSVEGKFRKTSVFLGLILRLVETAKARGYDMALISGTTRQLKLYQHLGFVPFGPQVGSGDATYQPMYLSLEGFEEQARSVLERSQREAKQAIFLPGPVAVHDDVAQAFNTPALSHRGDEFRAALQDTKVRLRELTGAQGVALMLGSGTLANDAVAAQLSVMRCRGLVLSNGEFGERLVDHARRWRLNVDVQQRPWGTAFDHAAIATHLAANPSIGWIWLVLSETSTGMLNDIEALRAITHARGVKLCLDAISATGLLPFNMSGVYLATSVSGKGLAAYPGISIVLSSERRLPCQPSLPRYLDLGLYLNTEHDVPFTQSSNLLFALQAALRLQHPARYQRIARAGAMLRAALRQCGFAIVADDAHASPAVTTIALPAELSGRELGERLLRRGIAIAYASNYLLERNWVQVCLFGEFTEQGLFDLIDTLNHQLVERDVSGTKANAA